MSSATPRIIERPDHSVSRRKMDPNALKVLYRLDRAGHEAYLVGGGVRDLMLGRVPKDYDLATSARPEEVRKLFRNSRIIGRRFRLVHVFFREGVVEVATFRAAPDREAQSGGPNDLLVTNDNTYGSPAEDAFRRDFTINALFYRISDFAIVDYVGGAEDLKRRTVRVIGDPDVRFREDPVRMLRAAEMAARLQFGIDEGAQDSIRRNRKELRKAAAPRLLEELLAILTSGSAGRTLEWAARLGLIDFLLPEVRSMTEAAGEGLGSLEEVIPTLDRRFRDEGGLDAFVVLGVLLAPHVLWERFKFDRRRAGRQLSRLGAAELVDRSLAPFAERFALPNLKARRTARALEVLLRLCEPVGDRRDRLQLSRHPAFLDALRIFEILVEATGEGGEAYDSWLEAAADTTEIPRQTRPRRRRRTKRKRRSSLGARSAGR